MICSEHHYERGPVRYKVSDYPIPGSGAHEITYFDEWYCRKCLFRRYEALNHKTDSYQTIAFAALPMPQRSL